MKFYLLPLFKRILISLASRTRRFIFFIVGVLIYGEFRMPSPIDELNIRLSGLNLRPINKDNLDYNKMWNQTHMEQRKGNYHTAVARRIEILESLYSNFDYIDEDYFPAILGTSWVSNFGHLGVLGHHVLAEKQSLIPKGTRTIVTGIDFPNKQLLKIVSGKYNLINHQNGNRWTEMSSFWPLSERLQTIRLSDGFIGADEFMNLTFKNIELSGNKDLYMSLPLDYIVKSRQQLFDLGLKEESKFVALHIRDSGKKGDPRTQPMSSYVPAIETLLERGIWVIKIGDCDNSELVNHPKYIDLTKLIYNGNILHPYILAKCMFFIATQSGPSIVARLFGTPTLHTNVSEIGSTVLCSSAGSIYLPKTWCYNSGQTLSLTEIFESKLAYAPSDPDVLKSIGIKCISNTSDEIIKATMEILASVESGRVEIDESMTQINSIRKHFNAPATGNFSNAYLKNNPLFCK